MLNSSADSADARRFKPALAVPLIRIIALASPLAEREVVDLPWTDTTIVELLRSLGINVEHLGARIALNGAIVRPSEWAATRVPAGSTLIVRLLPGDPITGTLLLTIAQLAAATVATQAAVSAGLVAEGLGATLIGAAAAGVSGIVGSLLLRAVIAPPSPPSPKVSTEPKSFSISGVRNVEAPYGVYPRVYGKRRVLPIVVGKRFTELLGNDQFLRVLLSAGYGPLNLTDIKIGQTAITQFQDVETEIRQGFSNDLPITLYPQSVNEVTLNVLLLDTGNKNTTPTGWQLRTTDPLTDEISVDMTAPQGLVTINSTGNRRGLTVTVQIRYAPTGTTVWVNRPDLIMHGGTMSAVRKGDCWKVARGQYDVQVQVSFITWEPNRSLNNTFIGTTFWTAIRSFHNEDPFPMKGMSKIALRIRASDQLSGEIDQISCLASSILPDWDTPTQTWITRETANPASVYRDLLQGAANKQPLPDSRLDLAAIQAWYVFSATKGFFFNGVFDSPSTLPEAMAAVTAVGRATRGFRSGLKYSTVIDQPQATPVLLVSPRNSRGFEVEKPFVDLPHALKVRYANPIADYRIDEILVYDDGFNADGSGGLTAATRFETLDLSQGVADATQAWKLARYHLAQARLRSRTCRVNLDFESFVLERGDLVELAHDVIKQGLGWGRIKSVTQDVSGAALSITCDERFTGDSASAYALRIRKVDGSLSLQNLITFSGDTQTLTFATPIAAGVPQPASGDLVTFGLAGQITGQFVCNKIEPTVGAAGELGALLHLVDYAPAIFDADASPPGSFTSKLTTATVPAPVISQVRSDDTALPRDVDGSLMAGAAIQLAGATALLRDYHVRIRYRVSARLGTTDRGAWSAVTAYAGSDTVTYLGSDWLAVDASTGITPGTNTTKWIPLLTDDPWTMTPLMRPAGNIFVPGLESGVAYDIGARFEYSDGRISDWTNLPSTAPHLIAGKTSATPDVTGLTASNVIAGVVQVKWDQSPARDLDHYEVRRGGTDWASATFLTVTRDARTADQQSAAGTYTYRVKAVDTSGNLSVNAASVSLSLSATDIGLAAAFDSATLRRVLEDTLANLPTAGDANRLFLATDKRELYRDNGSAWDLLLGPSARVLDRVAGNPAVDVVNSALEQSIYSYNLPAGTLSINGAVVVELVGDYLNNSGATDTVTFRFKWGGTTLFNRLTVALPAGATRRPLRHRFVIAGAGASNAQVLMAHSLIGALNTLPAMSGIADEAIGSTTTAVNTTAQQTIQVTVQHTTAAATIETRIYAAHTLLHAPSP